MHFVPPSQLLPHLPSRPGFPYLVVGGFGPSFPQSSLHPLCFLLPLPRVFF